MKVILNAGYYSGNYCKIGDLVAGDGQTIVDTNILPEEADGLKQLAYKYIDGVWVYDETKYIQIKGVQDSANAAEPTVLQLSGKIDYLAMMNGVELP